MALATCPLFPEPLATSISDSTTFPRPAKPVTPVSPRPDFRNCGTAWPNTTSRGFTNGPQGSPEGWNFATGPKRSAKCCWPWSNRSCRATTAQATSRARPTPARSTNCSARGTKDAPHLRGPAASPPTRNTRPGTRPWAFRQPAGAAPTSMEWLNKSQMAVLWLRGELRSVGRGGCPAFATIATDRGASDRHGRGENTQNGGSSTTTWWGTNRLLVITVENSAFRWPLKESFGKSQNAGDGLGSPRLRKQPRQVPVGPPYGFR